MVIVNFNAVLDYSWLGFLVVMFFAKGCASLFFLLSTLLWFVSRNLKSSVSESSRAKVVSLRLCEESLQAIPTYRQIGRQRQRQRQIDR